MPQQDRYVPGVPCWIDTAQPDPGAAIDFYAGLFGWTFEDVMPPGDPQRYAIGRIDGRDAGAVTSLPDGAPPAWNTYVWVDDADAAVARARDAGGRVLVEPMDAGDAGRMAVFADPEGAVLSVWQPARHRGAGIVNEHGSLNFNDLRTRDADAAAAFYGAVFGWELLPVGDGWCWALPGYGDFLEARTPGLREGMKQMGAPERFEDVVASLRVIGPGEPDVQPHWGVTFAVDDADAAAARAYELGGRVVVPPFDAPWTRMTVLADPAGAVFTASKYVPENKDVPTPSPADVAAAA